MFKFLVLRSKPADRPVRSAALKVFHVVRRAQHQVTQIPVKVKATVRDVSDAWSESGRIIPKS